MITGILSTLIEFKMDPPGTLYHKKVRAQEGSLDF